MINLKYLERLAFLSKIKSFSASWLPQPPSREIAMEYSDDIDLPNDAVKINSGSHLAPFMTSQSYVGRNKPQTVDSFDHEKPLGKNEIRVQYSYSQSAEENPKFRDNYEEWNPGGDQRPIILDNNNYFTGGSEVIELDSAYGLPEFAGRKSEIGFKLSVHKDSLDVPIQKAVEKYHELINVEDFNAPDDLPLQARVGNHQKNLAGKADKFDKPFFNAYVKTEVVEEGNYAPRVNVKLTAKIPLSDDSVDDFGGAASVIASKEIGNVTTIAGVDYIYQDWDSDDFNRAQNLDLKNDYRQYRLGLIHDPGVEGGFYWGAGAMLKESYIEYKNTHFDTANDSLEFYLSLNHRSKKGNHFFTRASEEKWWSAPGQFNPQSSDFRLEAGYSGNPTHIPGELWSGSKYVAGKAWDACTWPGRCLKSLVTKD